MVNAFAGPALGLVMTPFYLRQIGLDGLGLVGLMVVISSVLGLFIAGASKTYQRDISTAQEVSPENLSSLVKGGVILFAVLGFILGLIVFTFGHSQIHEMAQGTNISRESLDRSLVYIALLMTTGVMGGAISSTLAALRDQIWPNLFSIGTSILLAASTWFFLSRWPRVDIFYACQLIGSLAGLSLLTFRLLWLAANTFLKVPQQSMKEVWNDRLRINGKLAGVLIVHEGLGMIITQIDRILVTTLLPLSALGAYNLGANPARLATIVTSPINIVTYPELCRLYGRNASREETGEYISRVTFILTLMFAAAMIILITSSKDLLTLWLGPTNLPHETAVCLAILSCGHLLLAVAVAFYNVTVVHGRVSYGIYKNIAAILVLPPTGYLATKVWGLPGAAITWLLYGLVCAAICGTMVFKRHADLRAGRKWINGSIVAICTAAMVSSILSFTHLHGWQMIVASCSSSAAFCVILLTYFFGFNFHAWFHAIELKPVTN